MPKPSQTFAKFRALIGQAGLHFSYWGEYFNVIFDKIYSCSPFFSRERLIHLLAVRPYKKPELLLRMYKGELNGNETRQGSPVPDVHNSEMFPTFKTFIVEQCCHEGKIGPRKLWFQFFQFS